MNEFFNPNPITFDSNLPRISISQVLGMIQEPFDQQAVAQKTHDKNFNNPESQYYQKTVEQICEMWTAKGAESCRYGSLLDDYIGLNLTKTDKDIMLWKLDNNYDYDKRLHEHCDAFDAFYEVLKKSGNTEFVAREKTLYLNMGNFVVKGRFDALFRNKITGKYILVDWKSSASIDKTKGPWTKNLLGPCGNLPALNWFTYTLQLYFYKKALIDSGYLPEGTTYDDIEVMIVNLPDHIIEETGQHYATHKGAFQFDNELMDRLFKFAFQKQTLLNS